MTFTRTHNAVRFADPYKTCDQCGDWITGYLDDSGTPALLTPCEHASNYTDVCPSWSPVDGCTCPDLIGRGVIPGPMHATPEKTPVSPTNRRVHCPLPGCDVVTEYQAEMDHHVLEPHAPAQREPVPTQVALRCGLCLDVTGWHSATPDALAEHNAHRCRD